MKEPSILLSESLKSGWTKWSMTLARRSNATRSGWIQKPTQLSFQMIRSLQCTVKTCKISTKFISKQWQCKIHSLAIVIVLKHCVQLEPGPSQAHTDTANFTKQFIRRPSCLLLQAAIDRLGGRITELLANSQAAGEQGNVDAAQAAATQADMVKVGHGQLCMQCITKLV